MEDRLDALEREVQCTKRENLRLRWLVSLSSALTAGLFLFGFAGQAGVQEVVRTRSLLIVDKEDRPRIIMGTPIDDERLLHMKRNKPLYGIAFCDAKQNEQIGIGISEDGSVGMGFDTKPGVGNPMNRERINITVDADGGAQIRMLDNETRLKTLWRTSPRGDSALSFVDWGQKDGKPVPKDALAYGLKTVKLAAKDLFKD